MSLGRSSYFYQGIMFRALLTSYTLEHELRTIKKRILLGKQPGGPPHPPWPSISIVPGTAVVLHVALILGYCVHKPYVYRCTLPSCFVVLNSRILDPPLEEGISLRIGEAPAPSEKTNSCSYCCTGVQRTDCEGRATEKEQRA